MKYYLLNTLNYSRIAPGEYLLNDAHIFCCVKKKTVCDNLDLKNTMLKTFYHLTCISKG